jgi:polysaccharide biosynthesis/export protein
MKKNLITVIVCLLLFASCEPRRNLVYFSEGNPNSRGTGALPSAMEVKIQPDDILRISVNSLSVESNALFNPVGNEAGYKVDKSGNIGFPVVGLVKLEGLTLEEAKTKISRELDKYVKNSIVNMQFLNFKITVIGEVNQPNSFTITNNKVNLLEALGLAGDMTVYGKRENVLVIRQNGDARTMARINMNNREVLNSPYFNLKQNDIVYVEPDRAKAATVSNNNRYIPLVIGTVLSLTSIIFRVYY